MSHAPPVTVTPRDERAAFTASTKYRVGFAMVVSRLVPAPPSGTRPDTASRSPPGMRDTDTDAFDPAAPVIAVLTTVN